MSHKYKFKFKYYTDRHQLVFN